MMIIIAAETFQGGTKYWTDGHGPIPLTWLQRKGSVHTAFHYSLTVCHDKKLFFCVIINVPFLTLNSEIHRGRALI